MPTLRTKRRIIKAISFCFCIVFILNNIQLCAFAETNENREPIYDYILVSMENDYSFPIKEYSPEYFDSRYVKEVESIFTYNDKDEIEKEKFYRVEKLYLTDYGKINIDDFVNQLTERDDILVAERDYLFKNVVDAVLPNDPYFLAGYQYDKTNIMCQKAWAITKGTTTVKLGILDTGIKSVFDLSQNLDTNLSKSFIEGNSSLYDTTYTGHYHGTLVAGVAAAKGNNSAGICGVAWNAGIVNLRVIDSENSDSINYSRLVSAINYAKNKKIKILNMSFSISCFSNTALKNTIAAFPGICVISAGNDGWSLLEYPAKYNTDDDNIIVVASVDSSDELASSSNYHSSKVDLAAPGEEIYTCSTSGFSTFSGTSLAAPQVAGTLVLMKSIAPDRSNTELIDILLESVDLIPSLSNKVATGGRLNTFRAVRKAKGYLLGDADFDGIITPADARQVLRWALEMDSPTNLDEALCDVDYSNDLDPEDSRLILRMATGIIPQIE